MSEATTMTQTTGIECPVSRVSAYVNQAQRDIAERIQQVEFEALAVSSTSSGDDKLYLPTDAVRVLSLSYDTGGSPVGGRVIRQCGLDELDAKSSGTAAGAPDRFLSYATWIELYPSPNSAYSLLLRYVKRLSDITNLDSVPSVDTRYHTAVLFRTVEMLHYRKGLVSGAVAARNFYEAELRAMPSATAQRQRTRAGMGLRLQEDED